MEMVTPLQIRGRLEHRFVAEKSKPTEHGATEIIKALSYHGAFLKKHVVKTFRSIPLHIIGEEIPISFAQHVRAADLVAMDARRLFLVVECKKVASPKRWVFLRDIDDFYRVSRRHFSAFGASSITSRRPFPETPVCSDGYQYDPEAKPKNDQPAKRADPQAIYEAASQLCGTYLGFIQRRLTEIANMPIDLRPKDETYVPILVTNARLSYINVSDIEMDTTSGELTAIPEVFEVPHVVLNHPFASDSQAIDFRKYAQNEDWKLQFQESLYVVNVNSLGDFLADNHRAILVEAESQPRSPRT